MYKYINIKYMRFIKNNIMFSILVLFFIPLFFLASFTQAAIPSHLNYQGKLKDNGGAPIGVATTIQFSLYSHPTNGAYTDAASEAGPLLWKEVYDGSNASCSQITPGVDGIFAQHLSDCVAFPDYLDFKDEYYLGVRVGADPEATPRVPLSSNPYAKNSGRVGSFKDSGANVLTGEKTGDATAGIQGAPSSVLEFEGSGWSGLGAIDRSIKLRNSVVDSNNYRFSVLNNLNNEIFSVNQDGFVGLGATTQADTYLDIEDSENIELIRLSDHTNNDSVGFYTGNTTPEGALAAQVGSLFLDNANGLLYLKHAGDGLNTGWDSLVTSADVENIYNIDGTLTGDRILDKADNRLRIDGQGQMIFGASDSAGNQSSIYLNGASAQPASIEYQYIDGGSGDPILLKIDGSGAIITDEINLRGFEYAADYSANYTNRSLVDKAYVDQQLMWEIVNGGERIQPKNNSVKQIFVEENSNSYTQFKVRNNNDAGNGAGAIIELKGSGADYTNNMFIGKYGAGFWIPELRDNGAVLTDKNLVIGTASDSHEIHFVTGNSYTDLQPVVVADNEGFRYTSDLSATFVDRTLVDKAYVDNAIIAGTNNIYTADGTLTSERGLSGNGGAFGIAFTELNEFNIDDTGSINFESTGDGNFTAPSFNIGSYSTVTLDMTSGVSAIFNDHRVTKTGVEYGADYSANYTNRSLVDKEYVDNAITVGANNIYNNDGTIIAHRTVTFDDNSLEFLATGDNSEFNLDLTDTGNNMDSYFSLTPGEIEFDSNDGVTGVGSNMIVGALNFGFDHNDSTGHTNSFRVGDDILIIDGINNKGAMYAADYSANFVDRSLVDKAYVDGAITSGQPTFQDVVDRSIAVDGYAHADLGAGEIEDDGAMLAVTAHVGKDFDYGVDSFLRFSLNGGMGDAGHAYIYDERNVGSQRGLEYQADYSADFTNRTLVDKEYVDNQISPFDTTANVTSNENDDYANDDFVFGSSSLDDDGDDAHDRRFFFDKSKAAFRAGYTTGSEWNDANVGIGSIALGSGYIDGEGSITPAPIASGNMGAMAIGINSVASGDGSFATSNATASGYNSVAMANGDASGGNSFAAASGIANGDNSVAMAHGTTTGSYAVAMGNNTTAGDYSVAMGYLSTASGGDSIAMGQNSTASALGSVALGLSPTASGNASVALGQWTYARSYAETALGAYNTDYTPNDSTGFDASDRVFVIGNGTSDTNRSDAFIMLKDGSSTFTNVASYNADYSGSYTNHSLVDKAYVDNAVASGGSSPWTKSGTSLSPTAAGDDVLLNAGETLSISDLTQGSIPFIGAGGLVSQDNNNLFWDSGNNTMGIGTNTPSSALDINSNGANGVAIFTIGNTAGDIQMFRTDATPEGSVTGLIGDLAFDGTNGEAYIKNSGNSTNTGWLRMLNTADNIMLADADSDTFIRAESALNADEDILVSQANQTGNSILQEWRDGTGLRIAALDADGDMHLGATTYPAKSKLYFGHDHFNIGSYNNGRDFEFYSANAGGGGQEGFRFRFGNGGGMLNIRPSGSNIELSTLDRNNMLMFTTPYDPTTGGLSEKAPQFNPRGAGYFPNVSDKVLTIRNWEESIADNATIGTKAFFTRQGNLSIGTSPTSLSNGVRASLTIQNGFKPVYRTDGVTQVKVRTENGGGITATFPAYPNTAVPIQIHVGTKLTANGETRTVVSMGNKTSLTLDSSVDWYNGGSGYDVSYANPFVDFYDESMNSVFKVDTDGSVGIGVFSPTAQLHTTGTVRFANFGAGTMQTDANGNVSVSSDERLKNIQGTFNRGLNDLTNIDPIEYKWKEETGYDTENSYYGFSAQNVKLSIPEAVGEDKRGFLTLSDRPILATAVNAIKEMWEEITGIKEKVQEIDMLKTELCQKDNSYSWCNTLDNNEDNIDQNQDNTNTGGDTQENDNSQGTEDNTGNTDENNDEDSQDNQDNGQNNAQDGEAVDDNQNQGDGQNENTSDQNQDNETNTDSQDQSQDDENSEDNTGNTDENNDEDSQDNQDNGQNNAQDGEAVDDNQNQGDVDDGNQNNNNEDGENNEGLDNGNNNDNQNQDDGGDVNQDNNGNTN